MSLGCGCKQLDCVFLSLSVQVPEETTMHRFLKVIKCDIQVEKKQNSTDLGGCWSM